MHRIAIFIVLVLCLYFQTVYANTQQYFSSIQNNTEALYQFFLNMPKGGELHYHLTGGAMPETMISLAPKGEYCLDPKTYALSSLSTPCAGTHLTADMLQNHSKLYQSILHAWSMADFKPGKESGHDHFFSIFFKFSPIASQFAPELLTDVMKRAARQHEIYMEIMALPDHAAAASFGRLIKTTNRLQDKQKILLAQPAFQKNIQHTVRASNFLLKQTRQLLGCQSVTPDPACELTVKLQYIILREQPIDNFFAQALNGFSAAALSKNIVGINIVQAEDGPISLHDYHRQMSIIGFLHNAYPNVRIALHAGEITPKVLDAKRIKRKELRYHIQDAIVTGRAERIGHGVDILYEDNAPHLFSVMSKAGIPVEINLTSNKEILNVDGKQHPFLQYLKNHVPVVLSTDDEGILRTNLTQEYVVAATQHQLDYDTIKTINRNALTYSFMPGQSIWANPNAGVLIKECRDLNATSCRKFIANSPKAALQWRLEQQLIDFENQYN
jgi:adenosine deaminase